MPQIVKKKTKKDAAVICPVCRRYHWPNATFGPFCCASCLQTVIRPLILADLKHPLE
jgi:hypothetical protein